MTVSVMSVTVQTDSKLVSVLVELVVVSGLAAVRELVVALVLAVVRELVVALGVVVHFSLLHPKRQHRRNQDQDPHP